MLNVDEYLSMLVNQSVITDIKAIIAQSKDKAIRAVDHQRTLMYWHIGKRIFEEEQDGKERADYGTFLIKYLSEQLQPEFGSGFSIRQINLYRQFYRTFENVHTLYAQLSWSQYKLLLSVDSQDKREFYIAETIGVSRIEKRSIKRSIILRKRLGKCHYHTLTGVLVGIG
ncbi:DUF1016 N-terminal domain-containing protein [Parapedobacter sp.]